MSFNPLAPVSDANPLPIIPVPPAATFAPLSPITETNPLPVVSTPTTS